MGAGPKYWERPVFSDHLITTSANTEEQVRGWRVQRNTLKNTPLAFVQAGPMDPWASMQKALLDALVLH